MLCISALQIINNSPDENKAHHVLNSRFILYLVFFPQTLLFWKIYIYFFAVLLHQTNSGIWQVEAQVNTKSFVDIKWYWIFPWRFFSFIRNVVILSQVSRMLYSFLISSNNSWTQQIVGLKDIVHLSKLALFLFF